MKTRDKKPTKDRASDGIATIPATSDPRSNGRSNGRGAAKFAAAVEAGVARGGLAIYEREGKLFHYTPPEVANALRFFLARLQQSDEVPQQSIAITSALAGEGATSISRGLAALLANDLDVRVCLLETNWWPDDEEGEAKWWQTFGDEALPEHPGLAAVLKGSCSVEFALMGTSDPRLEILNAGHLPISRRAAAASGTAFSDVVELLTKRFEAVVIDVPPILKASEATTIARHADAAALVVRQGVTTEQQVKLAIDELTGIEVLGVILNRASTHLPHVVQRFTPT